jgi:hypothetical protein
LESDAYVTAKIYNGSGALLAFYKNDFANDVVDKDGPSTDNTYYGIGGAPTDETVDVHILCHEDTHAEQQELTLGDLGLAVKDGVDDNDDRFIRWELYLSLKKEFEN